MTTTELQTKSNERLNAYIVRIKYEIQTESERRDKAGRNFREGILQEYLNAAGEEGWTERQAWDYLKDKVPKTTYYRYLPEELKDPNKQNRKSSEDLNTQFGSTGTKTDTEESSSEFNTEGMGVAVIDEPEEVTQSVSCPPPTTSTDEEHDRLVARIQELEKMVSDLSFQKGSDTPTTTITTPPVQQIMILPHNMVLEVYDKRMQCGLKGFIQLKTENDIVTGIEVVNV